MAAQEQYYLTCDRCGSACETEEGDEIFGETPEECRGINLDEGGYSNTETLEESEDLCRDCVVNASPPTH